jgi:hypothetical protein
MYQLAQYRFGFLEWLAKQLGMKQRVGANQVISDQLADQMRRSPADKQPNFPAHQHLTFGIIHPDVLEVDSADSCDK